MPKQSTHDAAQKLHIEAQTRGHNIFWQHNTPNLDEHGSSIATGYIGRCSHPNCRLRIDVIDNESDELTLVPGSELDKLPSCPLNSDL